MPEGGLNIRLHDTPVAQEARLHDYKRFAAEAFARANRIDRRVWGNGRRRIGIVSAGKSWLDTAHALDLLGLDAAEAERLGITTYKVGMVWPLDMASFREWAQDLEHIIVVEEKRKLIEVQIKEAIFDDRRGRRVIGWKNEQGETVFTVKQALDPVKIARTLGDLLAAGRCRDRDARSSAAPSLDDAVRADNAEEIAVRKPWFCSGCPHNTSTRLPEGARAYAGIGCHYMVQWMDRDTEGFTHMGGEGANWIGEAPFSTRKHIFQNLGDGTYNHSGVQAIRAALAGGVNITYKILFNDAVAMTGGQPNEGGLTAQQIARELKAMGVEDRRRRLRPEGGDRPRSPFPRAVPMRPRDELDAVQREMQEVEGVIGDHLHPDLRRREAPTPQARPVSRPRPAGLHQPRRLRGLRRLRREVELRLDRAARDRVRPQAHDRPVLLQQGLLLPRWASARASSRSKAREVRKAAPAELALPDLPAPALPAIRGTCNIVITGVGGTGVVTVGALIAMAAHLEGKGAGVMEMAGLAQKGGAVSIHCRIAERPSDITAIRVAVGEADALIGGDLVVSAGAKTLGLTDARPHPGGGQRPRDHHRRLHPRPQLPPADRPADAGAARAARRGRARHARRDAARREAARRRDLRQRADARSRLAGGPRAYQRGGDAARDRDQRRRRRGQHSGIRDRPLGGGAPGGCRRCRGARGGAGRRRSSALSSLAARSISSSIRAHGWRGATARASTRR